MALTGQRIGATGSGCMSGSVGIFDKAIMSASSSCLSSSGGESLIGDGGLSVWSQDCRMRAALALPLWQGASELATRSSRDKYLAACLNPKFSKRHLTMRITASTFPPSRRVANLVPFRQFHGRSTPAQSALPFFEGRVRGEYQRESVAQSDVNGSAGDRSRNHYNCRLHERPSRLWAGRRKALGQRCIADDVRHHDGTIRKVNFSANSRAFETRQNRPDLTPVDMKRRSPDKRRNGQSLCGQSSCGSGHRSQP